MQTIANPRILLTSELQISCFYGLDHVEGSLDDTFPLAKACKVLYAIYQMYHLEIISA